MTQQQQQQQPYSQYEIGSHKFIVPSYYTLSESLGNGSFGMVVKAELNLNHMERHRSLGHQRANSQYNQYQNANGTSSFPNIQASINCAIKKVNNVFSSGNFQLTKKILREIKIMKHLKHGNILNLLDIIPPQNYNAFNDLYIVSELMECDLQTIIHSKETPLTNEHINYFMHQILSGLRHIHEAQILHRDLKPANILLNANCDLKICDFGLSRPVDFSIENPQMSTPYVATRYYRAPELLLCSTQATAAMDIWSTGCIFAELLGRRILFPGRNQILHQLELIVSVLGSPPLEDIRGHRDAVNYFLSNVSREKKPVSFEELFPHADPAALDLLSKMLQFNPDKRITAAEALRHPYFEAFEDSHNVQRAEIFDASFEDQLTEQTDMKRLLWEEIQSFDALGRSRSLWRENYDMMQQENGMDEEGDVMMDG